MTDTVLKDLLVVGETYVQGDLRVQGEISSGCSCATGFLSSNESPAIVANVEKTIVWDDDPSKLSIAGSAIEKIPSGSFVVQKNGFYAAYAAVRCQADTSAIPGPAVHGVDVKFNNEVIARSRAIFDQTPGAEQWINVPTAGFLSAGQGIDVTVTQNDNGLVLDARIFVKKLS